MNNKCKLKYAISLEWIGFDIDQKMKLFCGICETVSPGLSKIVVGDKKNPRRPWCAEITGFCQKFKFKREFLDGSVSLEKANSAYSRGVYIWFTLEQEKIYEYSSLVSWGRRERSFCRVNQKGEIEKLSENEVIECLKNTSE